MNRREFIGCSLTGCLITITGSGITSGCKSAKGVVGKINKDGLEIALDDFVLGKGRGFHPYLIIYNQELQYPICVYRRSEKKFVALYMRCTHLGAELQVSGERLICPAHGSEFDAEGLVSQGPADVALRSFPVSLAGDYLFIDLRRPL